VEPLSLHPENPHYFLFRGKPAVLISSGEHYGAVLNLDFDYVTYLDELESVGLNLTRVFMGVYHEYPGYFGIEGNSLAPDPDRFISPWVRSDVPGAADGGNRFDLDRWNDEYMRRLVDFCEAASASGIVVEICLFCPFYFHMVGNRLWEICPLHPQNNINQTPDAGREVYSLKHSVLLKYQEKMVKKIVKELNRFDNIYYEICNEPWADNISIEWQHHIADVIAATEESLPYKHLISQNISNGYEEVKDPYHQISILNFHYAPGEAVALNYRLGLAIGCNETGLCGTADFVYRSQAWEFILSGGALFNNLDYSFSPGYERGTYKYGPRQPGGGSPSLRAQLSILKDFVYSLDFIRMAPDASVVKRLHTIHGSARVLAERGRTYGIYIRGRSVAEISLDIPEGTYRAEWVDVESGRVTKTEVVNHAGGYMDLVSPSFGQDIALRVVRS